MFSSYSHLSTGLPELDKILKGIIPGDNVVWHTDSVKDYFLFVKPFTEHAVKYGHKLIYFHFASHEPLIDENIPHEKHQLDPNLGFESFINKIHEVIDKNGRGGYYVFDCLSELSVAWYSDQMLGNFFMLTCPYLLDIEAIAYFAILKNKHSFNAVTPIQQTTQLFIDVYNLNNEIFIHPVKVQQRYSPTLYMLHHWKNGTFTPVTKSAVNSEIFSSISWLGQESASKVFDIWNRSFIEAEYALENTDYCNIEKKDQIFNNLLKMVVTRDEKVLSLVKKFFTIEDLLSIGKRMIGTGLIGGKSVGMLLAQKILKNENKKWKNILELHDSFYIGSDIFYTYLVKNGCWWVQQQKGLEIFLQNAKHARRLILTGQFPDFIVKKFSDMLDYFGQSPIIVRSSSLLEDNFGNAFSGKYESVFCPNQGPREKCLEDLMTAVRTIYASTMSEKAIRYRAGSNLLDKDEQMSLLVQRVSGNLNANYFFPLIAGVGYSFNPFVWSEYIDAKAGVIRLVFGLGTRAVDRSDDDYTRLAALNDPLRRPEENNSEIRKYSQKKVDVIDLESNQLSTVSFEESALKLDRSALEIIGEIDPELEEYSKTQNKNYFSWIISFEKLFKKTNFINDMKEILSILQNAYNYPVDIEFTANFINENEYKINVVQCRPFQVKDSKFNKEINIESIKNEDIIFKSSGPVIGESRETQIDRIIYVVPEVYSNMNVSDRYSTARTIGKIINNYSDKNKILLIGPGRWGTTTPSLGVPVNFAEISKISILCEVVMMRSDLIPDVSLGTHFFNDLVEFDILYLALYPDKKDTFLNLDFLNKTKQTLIEKEADIIKYKDAVKIIDLNGKNTYLIHANSLKQQAVFYKG